MIFDLLSKEFLITAEKSNTNIFLTGVAGSGKSSLIDYLMIHTSKKFVLLGTTGTAAINIGGQTLHRFFGIGKDGKSRRLTRDEIAYIKATDGFIIDEGSMLRADYFDLLDMILRGATGCNKPFGGKQIIIVGDLLQLPPVLVRYRTVDGKKEETEEYKDFVNMYTGRFFFHAKSYNERQFKTINLQKVHRQDNIELITNLNLIRAGIQSHEILKIFNSRLTSPDKLNPKAIYIGSTNRIVDEINRKKLLENPNKEELLSASIRGDFDKQDYPVDRYIAVKNGCRIMFTVNNPDQGYSNGTLATLINYKNHTLNIELDDGNKISLVRKTWENVVGIDEFGDKIVAGTFTQYPIKIAHAITIHKSQGKTFNNVIIDIGHSGCFEAGMLYVALSRVTSLEGLQLTRLIKLSDIQSDINVKNFINKDSK